MKVTRLLLILSILILIISFILLSGCHTIDLMLSRIIGGATPPTENPSWDEKAVDAAVDAATIERLKEFLEEIDKKRAELLYPTLI